MSDQGVIERWQSMAQDEFDRLKRDEIREDLRAAFDAEVERRRRCPEKSETPDAAAIPVSDGAEFRLDWVGALKGSFGLIAGGFILFVVVMIIRHFAGKPLVGGDLGSIIAMIMVFSGILTLPRSLIRMLMQQTLRISSEGIALLGRQKTLVTLAATDLDANAWGFKENSGGDADPFGVIADAICKRGPYLMDGKRRIYLRVFGSKRVVEALRRVLPSQTPRAFILVAARGEGIASQTQRFVLFPGQTYFVRFADAAVEQSELPDYDLRIQVPHDADVLFTTEHDNFVTSPKKTKAKKPFTTDIGRIETKAGVIVLHTCE